MGCDFDVTSELDESSKLYQNQTPTIDTKKESSMAKHNGKSTSATSVLERARPIVGQRAHEIQPFGTIARLPIGLDEKVCQEMADSLNQILANTMTLRDLYKKHHWQVAGPTFYQLHLLFDKHYEEQVELVDQIAERIQLLGGLSIAMAPDVAEMTTIPRPPKGREEPPVQISRLLEAHEIVLQEARRIAHRAEDLEDDGTNDLLISNVVRTNELQTWFIAEHLVNVPTVKAN
jgi:starvation-inducible DNA-binding protein